MIGFLFVIHSHTPKKIIKIGPDTMGPRVEAADQPSTPELLRPTKNNVVPAISRARPIKSNVAAAWLKV